MPEPLINSIACLVIAKDEEKELPFALSSVEQICSQFVVVDTGSIDSTTSLCSRFGAEVHFFQWNGSFSDARNYGLNFIRSDWIIALDADEVLYLPSFSEFGEFSGTVRNVHSLEFGNQNKKIGGINVIIENYLGNDDTSPKTKHRYTRIFRNDPFIRYEGRIHEQIRHSIEKAGYGIIESDIIIRHYGYGKASAEKSLRNKTLLTAELVQNPDDIFLKYHLAETEFSMNNFDKAEELLLSIYSPGEQASHLEMGSANVLLSIHQIEMIRLRLGQIALSKNNFTEVEYYLNFTSTDIDREGFRRFILAASYMMQRRFDKAAMLYNSHEVMQSSMTDKNVIDNAMSIIKKIYHY